MAVIPCAEMMPIYGRIDLQQKRGARSKLLDETSYETVKRDLRPAAITAIPNRVYDLYMSRLAEDGMFFYPFYKVKMTNGFMHNEVPAKLDDPSSFTSGCITKEIEVAKELKRLYGIYRNKDSSKKTTKDADKKIGELLGYPDCCCEFYSHLENYDPVYESALGGDHSFFNSELYCLNSDPALFQHLRYFGINITPWFPCSYSCKESRRRSEVWFNVMKSLNLQLAEEILNLLKKPSTWDLYNGQVLITHEDFLGYVTSYFPKVRKVVHFNRGDIK